MENSEYWRMRFTQLEAARNRKAAEAYAEIEGQYRQAQKEIEGKIDAWYRRFAANNGVSMAEARRMLTNKELAELKWDVDEYIRHGQENALSQKWMKELENASARFHITRLEALKLQTQQSLEVMFGNQLDSVDRAVKRAFLDGYYHTAYEIQRGTGIGFDMAGLDQRQADRILRKPWAADGKNFSERIWGNRQKLISEVHTELSQNVLQGRGPQAAIDSLARKMGSSRANAGRLVMTESAYFSSAAQKECFNELGVEQYEILAVLDSLTSEICRELDGQVFPMKDYEPGVTAPPFHVNCRSTTVPHFGEDYGVPGKRAARNPEDGKTYYVPADMTYREWEKTFADGGMPGLKDKASDDKIKAQEEAKQAAEELKAENFPSSFTTQGELKNTQALVDYVNGLEGADANVVALFNRMGRLENIESNGIPFTISHGKNHAVSYSSYRISGNMAEAKLAIPKLQGGDLAGQVNTTLHEEMHLMDLYGRQDPQKPGCWFSTSRKPLMDVFKNASGSMSGDVARLFNEHDAEFRRIQDEIGAEYQKRISKLNDSVMDHTFKGNYNREYKKIKEAMKSELDYRCRNIMGGGIGNLQDIYDALSGGGLRDAGKVIYGHGSSYYLQTESRVHETFANYGALSVTRPDLIKLLRADKPELAAELDAAVEELLKKAGGG